MVGSWTDGGSGKLEWAISMEGGSRIGSRSCGLDMVLLALVFGKEKAKIFYLGRVEGLSKRCKELESLRMSPL